MPGPDHARPLDDCRQQKEDQCPRQRQHVQALRHRELQLLQQLLRQHQAGRFREVRDGHEHDAYERGLHVALHHEGCTGYDWHQKEQSGPRGQGQAGEFRERDNPYGSKGLQHRYQANTEEEIRRVAASQGASLCHSDRERTLEPVATRDLLHLLAVHVQEAAPYGHARENTRCKQTPSTQAHGINKMQVCHNVLVEHDEHWTHSHEDQRSTKHRGRGPNENSNAWSGTQHSQN
mmetsp:Transcript_13537/g.28264  ORF Transcript_13537/g.28264 Transcript_13537/m.28264 type:complete len:234 (-) Transcript_13537:232-933(-)